MDSHDKNQTKFPHENFGGNSTKRRIKSGPQITPSLCTQKDFCKNFPKFYVQHLTTRNLLNPTWFLFSVSVNKVNRNCRRVPSEVLQVENEELLMTPSFNASLTSHFFSARSPRGITLGNKFSFCDCAFLIWCQLNLVEPFWNKFEVSLSLIEWEWPYVVSSHTSRHSVLSSHTSCHSVGNSNKAIWFLGFKIRFSLIEW